MTKNTRSTMQAKSKYTADDIPVKSITNGTIVLNNNYKVTGVKIVPRNIFIMESEIYHGLKI